MPEFRGVVFDDVGVAVPNATVNLYDADSTSPSRANAVTDASGLWHIGETGTGSDGAASVDFDTRRNYDVKIAKDTDVVWLRSRDRYQVSMMQAWQADSATVPAAVFTNAYNAVSSLVAIFEGDKAHASAADNDEAYNSYKLSDDGGNQDEVARVTWHQYDVDSAADGGFEIEVASAGTLYKVFDAVTATGGAQTISIGTGLSGTAITLGHATSEVTVADNLTVTGTLTLGSGAVLIEAELEMLDGITAGTAAASKAVVLDGSKNIATIGTIGSGAITSTGTSSFGTASFSGLISANGGITFTDGDDIAFTGASGTNDITLVDSLADALSITRAGTDMVVFNSSAPSITFTPVTTFTGAITASGGVTGDVTGNVSGTAATVTTASQGNITTLAALTSLGAAGATTNVVAGDVTMYNAVNDGNPTISVGSSSAERLLITTSYVSGGQLLEYVKFSTVEASSTADRGKYIFDVDGTDIATIDDGGVNVTSGSLEVATIDYTDGDNAMTIADGGGVTFSAAAVGATLTDTSNTGDITLDFDAYQNFVLTFTGNVELQNPSTEKVGQSGVIVFIQDGTGSRTLAVEDQYFGTGGDVPTISTAANSIDVIPYFVVAAGKIALGDAQLAFAEAS